MRENKLRFLWKKRKVLSIRVPTVFLLVAFGMVPMLLCTAAMVGSFRQQQIDSRMIEVQNQCQILSSKLTRSGYLRGEAKDGIMDSEISTMADVYNGRIVV